MIIIDNTICSDDLVTQYFCCDLQQCKGYCCIEGDAGAPVTDEEVEILKKEINAIKPFMTEAGKAVVEKEGVAVVFRDGEWVTPLVNNRECVYVIMEDDIAKCAIEKAHQAGACQFLKPISCHLYPVRITEGVNYLSVNYHQWHICEAARALGKKEKIKCHEFLKTALIRRFGSEWYEQLQEYVKHYVKK